MNKWLEAELTVRTEDDIARFEQTPIEAWELPRTVYEAIAARARAAPDALAIRFVPIGDKPDEETVMPYAELVARITQTANLLRSLGVGPTDAVALLLPNTPDAQVCLWAAETAGIACPINFMLEPVQIASIIEEAQCKVLVTLAPHPDFDIWEKCGGLGRSGLRSVVQVSLASDAVGAPAGVAPPDWGIDVPAPRIVQLNNAALFASDELSFELDADAHPVAAIFHTGGTTGKPKLALQTHANQIANCWQQGVSMGMKPGHTRLCGLPLFHVNGALANGLALFMAGATLVLTGAKGYRDAGVLRNFWTLVQRYRANSFAAVPTFLVSLIQVPIGASDISSLEFVRCGTAPLSRQLARDFTALSGVEVIEGYGLTEATSISAMNPRFGEKRIGSVGLRVPYQQVEIRNMKHAGGPRACAVNELGQVFVKGPNVISGYMGDADTAAAFGEGGWYDTGDIGRLDEAGYLWLTGREKDIIIRGGHNLDPGMIEEAFYAHPAVGNVAAIGRPDRYTGEMPVVYVSLKPGTSIDSESLLRFAADRIPERAAVPKQVRIVSELPLTAVGKVFKPALRKQAARDGYLDALGGMTGAYNMTMTVDDTSGETIILLTCTNLSVTLHEDVRRFVGDALKTFTFRHELTFAERL